ncbi:hypothetical protein P9112_008640 [Eukaryota sp. TZLM1-RC]
MTQPAWKLALQQKRQQSTLTPPASSNTKSSHTPQSNVSNNVASRIASLNQAKETTNNSSSTKSQASTHLSKPVQRSSPSSTHSPASTVPSTVLSGAHTVSSDNSEPGLSRLILAVNKLQDAFSKVDISPIDLPQIAVVGSQSAGKSSVLEAIVGRDFLPRGSGIVTRRPLILQLIRDPEAIEDYGVFSHCSHEKFYDFSLIEREIADETDRLVGKNTKNISSRPITLKVFSSNALDLTLIDLPGLTKISIAGQDQNIAQEIRKMVLHFISKPNCIILALSPANVDLANSDSLEIAKEVDPQGKRTIGVLTKLDLMDEGTDALDIMEGKVYPMKFIGVVNRSQKDINSKKDMAAARLDEQHFFESHPAYSAVASRMGTLYLAKKLNNALIGHIKSCLPDIRRKVTQKLDQAEKELGSFGADDSDFARRQTAFGMLQRFCRNFTTTIEGSNTQELDTVASGPHSFESELLGGARIKNLFSLTFKEDIRNASIEGRLSDDQIRKYLLNTTGTNSVLHIPEQAFCGPIKVCISQLVPPSIKCVQEVYKELVNQTKVTAERITELSNFSDLKVKLLETCSEMISSFVDPTIKFVEKLVECEMSWIDLAALREKTAALNSNSYTLLEGFLLKKSGARFSKLINRKKTIYERRWFVLKANTLFYFNDPESISPNGLVSLDGCLVRTATECAINSLSEEEQADEKIVSQTIEKFIDDFGQFYLSICHRHPDKVILHGRTTVELVAESSDEYEVWLEALRKACRSSEADEQNDIECIRTTVCSYMDDIQSLLLRQVPKAIMYSLVNPVKTLMEKELMAAIYDQEVLDELLNEDPSVREQRQNLRQMVAMLKEASQALKDVAELRSV